MPYKELGNCPAATSEAVRRSMKGNRSKDTKPELLLRQALRQKGEPGYRLHWKAPGRPDLAYPGRRVAVFVHGDYWHRCPLCNLPEPKSNQEYWRKKFALTEERDARKLRELESEGWRTIVLWECEVRTDPSGAADKVLALLHAKRA